MTPQWTMPRDMSGFSTLEAALLAAIHTADLPEPVAEYRFVPRCCGHTAARHKTPERHGVASAFCARCEVEREFNEWHRLDAGRLWRFDFAWPALKLAAECEGGTYSGGRHTTGAGFEKDAEKYNTAAVQGWTVLRFTQRQITSGAALEALSAVVARLSLAHGA